MGGTGRFGGRLDTLKDPELRLLIAGTPKTGNVWLERLLAHAYAIPIVDLSRAQLTKIPPPGLSGTSYVTHQHYSYSTELIAWSRREHVRILTMLRHPADVFVSFYHYLNTFTPLLEARGWQRSRSAHALVGQAIDSPQVLEYLRSHFLPNVMERSLGWFRSGEALVVRYEALAADGLATLSSVTAQLEPAPQERLSLALQQCAIDATRQVSDFLRLHCRDGSLAQWRHQLSPRHIEIFQTEWADELASMGYDFS